jgi:hypothetical protein
LSSDKEGALTIKNTVLDNQFWTQARYVLQFTKPIYNMIKFSYSDWPMIGEVYEQMDSMLGLIKDIVEPKDVNMYNLIRVEVEKRWEMLNIPLHALAYVLKLKYYHISWLSTLAPGGGTKKKPHQDLEVEAGRIFFKQFFYNNFFLWFMFISIFYLWFIFINYNSFLFMINYNCCRLYESIRQNGPG